MPMSYPDLESLKRHGKMFGVEYAGESESEYREILAVNMLNRGDVVWAHEIRVGKGWDKWNKRDMETVELKSGRQPGDVVIEAVLEKKDNNKFWGHKNV